MLITISLWIFGSFLLSALLGWRRICIQTPSRGFAGANYSGRSETAESNPRARRLVPNTMTVADDRLRRRIAALTRLAKRR